MNRISNKLNVIKRQLKAAEARKQPRVLLTEDTLAKAFGNSYDDGLPYEKLRWEIDHLNGSKPDPAVYRASMRKVVDDLNDVEREQKQILKSLAAKPSAKRSGQSDLNTTRDRIASMFGETIAKGMSAANLMMAKALTDGQLCNLAKQARQSSPTAANRPAPINPRARLAGRKIETRPGMPGVIVDNVLYPSLDAVPDIGDTSAIRKGANQSESDRNRAELSSDRWKQINSGKIEPHQMSDDERGIWNGRERARRELADLERYPENRRAQQLHYWGKIPSEDGQAAQKYIDGLKAKANARLKPNR